MKTKTTESKLILWKPDVIGESVFGEVVKVIDVENGKGVIIDNAGTEILVPLTATLKGYESDFVPGLYAVVSYLADKKGQKGEYKVMHAMFFEAENEQEESYLQEVNSSISGNSVLTNHESGNGAFSTLLISDKVFREFFEAVGVSQKRFAQLEN